MSNPDRGVDAGGNRDQHITVYTCDKCMDMNFDTEVAAREHEAQCSGPSTPSGGIAGVAQGHVEEAPGNDAADVDISHAHVNSISNDGIVVNKTLYKCSICKLLFFSSKSASIHESVCTERTWLNCSKCNVMRFRTREECVEHEGHCSGMDNNFLLGMLPMAVDGENGRDDRDCSLEETSAAVNKGGDSFVTSNSDNPTPLEPATDASKISSEVVRPGNTPVLAAVEKDGAMNQIASDVNIVGKSKSPSQSLRDGQIVSLESSLHDETPRVDTAKSDAMEVDPVDGKSYKEGEKHISPMQKKLFENYASSMTEEGSDASAAKDAVGTNDVVMQEDGGTVSNASMDGEPIIDNGVGTVKGPDAVDYITVWTVSLFRLMHSYRSHYARHSHNVCLATALQCDFCQKEQFEVLTDAVEHEKMCPDNPDNMKPSAFAGNEPKGAAAPKATSTTPPPTSKQSVLFSPVLKDEQDTSNYIMLSTYYRSILQSLDMLYNPTSGAISFQCHHCNCPLPSTGLPWNVRKVSEILPICAQNHFFSPNSQAEGCQKMSENLLSTLLSSKDVKDSGRLSFDDFVASYFNENGIAEKVVGSHNEKKFFVLPDDEFRKIDG